MMNRDPITGRFVKGMTSWNKGKFGWMGANRTSFTKEDLEKRRQIGKITQGKGQLVCNSEEKIPVKSRNGKIYMHQKRVSYAKWLMEKKLNRKLETNEVVYHMDGNPYNNDIGNLTVITRKELAIINRRSK